MLTRHRTVLLTVTAVALLSVLAVVMVARPSRAFAAEDAPPPVPVHMLAYDATGTLLEADADRLKGIIEQARKKPPTDIFIAAHGWLNTEESAMGSYDCMRDLLVEVAREQSLLSPDYQALRLGIYWPSMKLMKTRERLDAETEKAIAEALSGVSDERSSAADPEKNARFHRDVKQMQELLKTKTQKGSADFKRNFEKAHQIFRRHALDHSIESVDPEDVPDADSIKRALQLYTFWQMKQRAGIEGTNGVNPLIARLQQEFPKARVHLIGHSFGCKLVLAALTKDLPRPVDTVVLLQGAVSFQAFADKVVGIEPATEGGYRKVLGRVSGPIVATFSTHDRAVGEAYPAASHLARQIGECDRRPAARHVPQRWYRGLGAAGIYGQDPVEIAGEGHAYHFAKGLYSIDGSKVIGGHSDVFHKEVAWLIWAAVLRR